MTNASDGDPAATSRTGPAALSQFRVVAGTAESAAGTGGVAAVSAGGGAFEPSHAARPKSANARPERRKGFMLRNLDLLGSPSTAGCFRLRHATYAGPLRRRVVCYSTRSTPS